MLRTFLRHGHLATFTLVDQGLFSSANFIVNIMLARWMSIGAYGEVTLVLNLSLTVLLIYSNFLIEPMAVLGFAIFSDSLKRYYRMLFLLHLVLVIFFFILCMLAAPFLSNLVPEELVWMLAASTPFLLLIWLLRRLPYTESRPRIAAEISGLYALVLVSLTVASKYLGILSVPVALAIFSLASVIPLLRFRSILRGSWRADIIDRPWLSTVLSEHWRFSRPLVMAAVLCIPTLNVQTVLTSYFLSVDDVGILRAVAIFVMPASILATAAGNLILSVMVRDKGNVPAIVRKVHIFTVMLVVTTVIYCILVFVFGSWLDATLYAGKFHDHVSLIGLLALSPMITALGAGWTWGLRAVQITRHVLVMTAIGGALSLIASFILIPRFGLTGAALSSLAAPIVYTATVIIVGRRWANMATA